jgi:AcrR family transcriptional regulator
MTRPVLSLGTPRPERADATRNRLRLLATARAMLAECGPDQLTMDALAERSGLGKGTVFRRFGSRSGIFQALLDDSERTFQERVLSGPPPLGPGAAPEDRLVAYGEARIRFLAENQDVARSAFDGRRPMPSAAQAPLSRIHIRILLAQTDLGTTDLDVLTVQLAAALDGPLLLHLSAPDPRTDPADAERRLRAGWRDLIHRVCRPAG